MYSAVRQWPEVTNRPKMTDMGPQADFYDYMYDNVSKIGVETFSYF